MLQDFVVAHRNEIIDRCRSKVTARSPPDTPLDIDHVVPLFLDQLIDELDARLLAPRSRSADQPAGHGYDLLQGFTPLQLVDRYGDVCQAMVELAVQSRAPISADDFGVLIRSLDTAIASARTPCTNHHAASTRKMPVDDEHLGGWGGGRLRLIVAAGVAFCAIKLTVRAASIASASPIAAQHLR